MLPLTLKALQRLAIQRLKQWKAKDIGAFRITFGRLGDPIVDGHLLLGRRTLVPLLAQR